MSNSSNMKKQIIQLKWGNDLKRHIMKNKYLLQEMYEKYQALEKCKPKLW